MKVSSILNCFRRKQNTVSPQTTMNRNDLSSSSDDNEIKIIRNNWVEDTELERNHNECIICLDEREDLDLTLPCMHRYHKKCIQRWNRESPHTCCPMCKNPYNINLIRTDNIIEHRRNIQSIQHILHFSGDIINIPAAPANTPPRIARFRRFNRNRNILS